MAKTKSRAPKVRSRELSLRDAGRLVPSDDWFDVCKIAINRNEVKLKDDIGAELRKRGVFPPGPCRKNPSPVLSPMVPCNCRDCGGRRLYPFYYRKGAIRLLARFEVTGVNVAGESVKIKLAAENEAGACRAALRKYKPREGEERDAERERKQLVSIVSVRQTRRSRRLRASDECRFNQEAVKLERKRRAEQARDAAQAERDYRGLPVVDEPEPNPSQVASEAMKFYGVAPVVESLEPEDEQSLRAECEKYLALAGTKQTTISVKFA